MDILDGQGCPGDHGAKSHPKVTLRMISGDASFVSPKKVNPRPGHSPAKRWPCQVLVEQLGSFASSECHRNCASLRDPFFNRGADEFRGHPAEGLEISIALHFRFHFLFRLASVQEVFLHRRGTAGTESFSFCPSGDCDGQKTAIGGKLCSLTNRADTFRLPPSPGRRNELHLCVLRVSVVITYFPQ